MRWDLFCKVIDNHGDLGVCWRLACQLAAQGDAVRLWVDDGAALRWMAPVGRESHEGIDVVDWSDADAVRSAAAAPAPDVLVEAFGCDPAPELIARFADAAGAGGSKRSWINLEYLSAEPYVERLHRLPSPVFRGPGEGLTKHFFYPGFTPATGGLLREPDLRARQAVFDRADWLSEHGIEWHGEPVISLFCYEPSALPDLLVRLDAIPTTASLLVTAGRATVAVEAVANASPGAAISSPRGLQRRSDGRSALSISYLPHLTQSDFDHLLWASDLNFVRGEDSLVRALWAGAPFVWQIFPQDDDAHHVKLEAFLDWLQAPPSLRHFHRLWNGFEAGALPAIDNATLAEWQLAAQAARERLLAQDDLVTRLRRFIAQKS